MGTVLDERRLLRALFDAAVASAQPARVLAPHLPAPPTGRTIVVGAGKASAAMAEALETHWKGDLEGVVVTRYGYATPSRRIAVVEAAHPVPDAAGIAAAQRVLAAVADLTPNDLVIALISGGGSALLPLPAPGVSLDDKQVLGRALLASGAKIAEINCVRRHLSAIKGGRLAAACHPAHVVTLAISDVPGDDPTDIASGPTVADPTTLADAREVLRRYGIDAPPSVRRALHDEANESVKPGDARIARAEYRMIATPQMALEAAAAVARESGVAPVILSDRIEGEARDVGKVMAAIAQQVASRGQPVAPPCVLLSGGETTVTVRGKGRGGRNVEFLLALALALHGSPGIHALAADTDGVDGAEEVAGAIVTPDTLARARGSGRRPADDLARNDAHAFFAALGDTVVTGPTRTNVNDFRAILVTRRAASA
jgi:hydroxypyruvate reductase